MDAALIETEMLMKKQTVLTLFVLAVLCLAPVAWSEIVAREGKGYLEVIDSQRVLHLKGTPYELGYQHGKLLDELARNNIMSIVDNQSEIGKSEEYQMYKMLRDGMHERLLPHIPKAYIEEMKGLAEGCGLRYEDVLIANLFPEAFHCSGIALMGKATQGGELYHVRLLDYMTNVGLQDYAVLMIVEPEGANAFMNVSYAGSIGSITGMNEKQIAIGEMGGDGVGHWDGMPMSFLLRYALEHASTLDEAKAIFRDTPRTCEYYYVISDAKTSSACGVYATVKDIHFIEPGESHGFLDPPQPPRNDSGGTKSLIKNFTIVQSPWQTSVQSSEGKMVGFLNTPPEDAVIISGPDRYLAFAERLSAHYGQVNEVLLQEMIKRPVSMKSNLHNAIFRPKTLEAWVSHAGSDGEPACNMPYHYFQLKKQP
jgi:isopenicillin-N N-acyltransferase like protein